MPRRLRLRVSDCPLHIIQRGNNRAPCFFEDTDYLVYLQNLRTLSGEADCRIHAYVLMTNHVHLLLTPAAAEGPSNLMKNLGQRYVQYINRRYNRSGSLWEGRFRSSLVETERYFLTCQRYIELNPVRAGMVRTPEEYKWSSHAANGLGVPDSIVSPHPEYLRLGSSEEDRLRAYRELVADGLSHQTLDHVRAAANGGYAFGSPDFEQTLSAKLGRSAGRRAIGRPTRNRRPLPVQKVV
jgi:putative transposase